MLQTRVNKRDNSNNYHDAADDDTNRTSTSKNLQLKKMRWCKFTQFDHVSIKQMRPVLGGSAPGTGVA